MESKEAYIQEIINKGFLEETDRGNRMAILAQVIEKILDDGNYINKHAIENFDISRGNNYIHLPYKQRCLKNPFSMMEGGSTKVAYEFLNQLKEEAKKNNKTFKMEENKIGLEIFADQTYCGCGILVGYKTQEESTLRDANPSLLAHLIGNNKITKKNTEFGKMYEYNSSANLPLSTSDGYIIKGEIKILNCEKILDKDEIFPVNFIFTSMPSLSGAPDCLDKNGVYSWTLKCRDILSSDKKLNEDQKKALYELIETLLSKRKSKDNSKDCYKEENFGKTMKLLMFYEKINLPNNTGEIDKTIEQLNNIITGGSATELADADINYQKTIRESIRAWIVMSRCYGIKYFIGGAVGCGVFENKPEVVSQIIAEEFVNYGGDMKYIYAAFNGSNDTNYPHFRDAFEKAFNDIKKDS